MLLVVFRSRLSPQAGDDYRAMADEMLERARHMPGFVDFAHYASEDGERVSLIRWQDEETMRAWREDARHRVAQRLGREKWYAWYSLEVAEIVRSRERERPS